MFVFKSRFLFYIGWMNCINTKKTKSYFGRHRHLTPLSFEILKWPLYFYLNVRSVLFYFFIIFFFHTHFLESLTFVELAATIVAWFGWLTKLIHVCSLLSVAQETLSPVSMLSLNFIFFEMVSVTISCNLFFKLECLRFSCLKKSASVTLELLS